MESNPTTAEPDGPERSDARFVDVAAAVLCVQDATLRVGVIDGRDAALPRAGFSRGVTLDDAVAKLLRRYGITDPDPVTVVQVGVRVDGDETVVIDHLAVTATAAPTLRWMPVGGVELDGGDPAGLDAAVDALRALFEHTPVATRLVAEPFTLTELREVYEAVWGTELHAANFARRVLAVDGFIEATGDKSVPVGRGRPAALHVAGSAEVLSPPLLRS